MFPWITIQEIYIHKTSPSWTTVLHRLRCSVRYFCCVQINIAPWDGGGQIGIRPGLLMQEVDKKVLQIDHVDNMTYPLEELALFYMYIVHRRALMPMSLWCSWILQSNWLFVNIVLLIISILRSFNMSYINVFSKKKTPKGNDFYLRLTDNFGLLNLKILFFWMFFAIYSFVFNHCLYQKLKDGSKLTLEGNKSHSDINWFMSLDIRKIEYSIFSPIMFSFIHLNITFLNLFIF